MTSSDTGRIDREIGHGRRLAARGAETAWGWASPAGQVRARRRAALIARGANLGPASVALEVGCGTGLFTALFLESGCALRAIDVSPDLLAIARQRGLPRVEFEEAPLETYAQGELFDAVIGSSVLHHLDLPVAFHAMLRLLKPGGVMSFAEPNILNPQVWAERRLRWLFPGVSPDETAFARFALRRTLTRVGFADVRIRPFDWLHPLTPAPLIGVVSRVGRVLEQLPAARECAGSLHIVAVRPRTP
jgi:SAM-dependent methyltransferase